MKPLTVWLRHRHRVALVLLLLLALPPVWREAQAQWDDDPLTWREHIRACLRSAVDPLDCPSFDTFRRPPSRPWTPPETDWREESREDYGPIVVLPGDGRGGPQLWVPSRQRSSGPPVYLQVPSMPSFPDYYGDR